MHEPHAPATAKDEPTLGPGDLIAGRYRVLRALGQGGYSLVFAASDTALGDRLVAIKLLRAQGGHNDPSALGRMRQEAMLLRAITHPHVITIHDFEQHGDQAFLVMEMIEGLSLAHIIHQQGPAPTDRVLPIVRQLLGALAAVHDHNVLHRDIKPENILIAPDGPHGEEVSKLVDFGLAKLDDAQELEEYVDELGVTLVKTRAGGFLGTPRYSAPEQALGEQSGPYTDLFSLGLVIAEWLTGTVRLQGATHGELMRHLVSDEPVDVRDCPSAWRSWLRQIMAKSPEARFAHARQALGELERLVAPSLSGKRVGKDFVYDPSHGALVHDLLEPEEHTFSFIASQGPLELDIERVERADAARLTNTPALPSWGGSQPVEGMSHDTPLSSPLAHRSDPVMVAMPPVQTSGRVTPSSPFGHLELSDLSGERQAAPSAFEPTLSAAFHVPAVRDQRVHRRDESEAITATSGLTILIITFFAITALVLIALIAFA